MECPGGRRGEAENGREGLRRVARGGRFPATPAFRGIGGPGKFFQIGYSDGKTLGFGIYRRLKEKVGEDFSRFRLWSTAKAVVAVGVVALNLGF
jgi:hypothetical protein